MKLDASRLDDHFGARVAPDGNLVRDNFVDWFGGSHAVDVEGAPVRAFHGSRVAHLDSFDRSFVGSGVVSHAESGRAYGGGTFFTSSRENALFYADPGEDDSEAAYIVEAYLSIQRPYLVSDLSMTATQAIKAALQANFDHAQAGGDNGDFDDLYDGVIVQDVLDGSHHSDVYVVFSPSQIKSVHNSGQFDPESDSLLDQRADLQEPREKMR